MSAARTLARAGLIVSGAFGLFRRDVVVDAGGYDTTTVGEDAELIVRLHRHCREQSRPYKITFVADPICWTVRGAPLASMRRMSSLRVISSGRPGPAVRARIAAGGRGPPPAVPGAGGTVILRPTTVPARPAMRRASNVLSSTSCRCV